MLRHLSPVARHACAALAALALAAPCHAADTGLAAGPASTMPGPSPVDDGRALHERDCVGCHAKQFGGDATRIYTRPDHRVHDKAQLAAQVAFCANRLKLGYFPEEEEHVAAYLNLRFYNFKP